MTAGGAINCDISRTDSYYLTNYTVDLYGSTSGSSVKFSYCSVSIDTYSPLEDGDVFAQILVLHNNAAGLVPIYAAIIALLCTLLYV
jgi:hypothetical protein